MSKDIIKRARRPMGVPRRKMPIPSMPGYIGRWINDTIGRIAMAIEGGYEYVSAEDFPELRSSDVFPINSDLGSRVSRVVGVNPDNSPLRAYLMRIKKEWYDEDQQAKAAAINEVEHQINRGTHNEKSGDKRYVKHISSNIA